MVDDPRARVDAICARHGLDDVQGSRLVCLLQALHSQAGAPTSVRQPRAAVDVHLADSLCALEVAPIASLGADSSLSLLDIGTGAGFPGLPLAIALPTCRLTLLDSRRRRCQFVERTIQRCEIENAAVVCARCEDWGQGRDSADVITARAVAAQAVVLEYAAPLLALGGILIDWRGRRDVAGEQRSLAAAETLGLERVDVHRVEPFVGARDHHLHLYRKVAPTPDRFPRRPGVAAKRQDGGVRLRISVA